MAPLILRENPPPNDESWIFTVPPARLSHTAAGMGKHVSFSPQRISFDLTRFPANRILQSDDISQFILASFEQLRFPDESPSVAREYMLRLFRSGLFLNGVQYRFYGHSNSQLRSRSCFLRRADSDEELNARIYVLGDFQKIMNPAKRAKRIGLLFSEAKIDWILDPRWTKDVEDIVRNGENFSDGCGLISTKFAVQLSRHKKIIFRGRPYTPCVYQIRYRGYKGVMMIEPALQPDHAHFRKSQKKFTATGNNTFSVVNHSVPYAFGRLNNEIVVLLSSLGISTDTFLKKQSSYHKWIEDASSNWEVAFDLLSALGHYALAERLLLDGLDSDNVQRQVKKLQNSELLSFKKNDRIRVRMLVPKSRFLFGICDPYGVLREGEVHVRLSVPRKGATTLTNVDVLIVRNPCLHPGDCLKLRAVYHPRLCHLVDCLVFATRGSRAAPSMSSGGDLDGDQFTVIWDPVLVPSKVAESYTYPASKEHISNNITRQDLAKHFASYNSITLGRVTALHAKWVRCSPKGAMCDEFQELNALYSAAVDGAPVKVPERLLNPPKPTDSEEGVKFVLDVLHAEAKEFADNFHQRNLTLSGTFEGTAEDAEDQIITLLSSNKLAVSEYEVFTGATLLANKYGIDLTRYLSHVDFSALTTAEKYAITTTLRLTPVQESQVWNSLVRSDILTSRDLEDRDLGGPLRLQRLYASRTQGRAAFFEYLRLAVQDYNRRVIFLKTDERFAVGIFLRGDIAWNDEPEINDNVVVCSFMPQSSTTLSTYRRSTKGYKLHCSDNQMQLFNRQRGDTFIFMTRPPEKSGADIIISIALQKISEHIRRQCGRVNRTPVVDMEIHVVSNRDRVGHQLFDLRFEHVQTEELLDRFDYRPQPYTPASLVAVNWVQHTQEERDLFTKGREEAFHVLVHAADDKMQDLMFFAIKYRSEDRIFWILDALLMKEEPSLPTIATFLDSYPPLAYSVLKKFMTEHDTGFSADTEDLVPAVLRNIIRSTNELRIAALVALEKLVSVIEHLDFPQYLGFLWLSSISIRSAELVQEILLVLHECRSMIRARNPTQEYVHKHALAVACDRAEEAADSCPCDQSGNPKRQSKAPTRAKLRLPKASAQAAEEQSDVQAELGKQLPKRVVADIRVDAPTPVRIHSHVRLKVSSSPIHSTLPAAVLDAVVVRASRGELYLDPLHPLPPEYAEVDWNIYDAGSVATSKAMLDAVQKLSMEGFECCQFHDIITGEADALNETNEPENEEDNDQNLLGSLNASQSRAIASSVPGRLNLIWGPPGTGKTTVVVQILLRFLREEPDTRILMTASTHNAVDNVLERFVAENSRAHLLNDDQILRAATESSRVNKALQKYTVDARLGGSLNDDPRLIQKAERRMKEARIVFTTCSGAGLGILRNMDYETVLIDEASQITEPGTLIPLVKGCRTAVLVGDHVQLRPTVRPMSKALEYDKSLFERLYTGPTYDRMSRVMLEVQYRFPAEIAQFPSDEFYDSRLQTGHARDQDMSITLSISAFPWPLVSNKLFPVIFVPCSSEEDYGRSSKSNLGQVNLVKHILSLLRSTPDPEARAGDTQMPDDVTERLHATSIVVLTPYSRQVQLLSQNLPSQQNTVVSTIDGFQGREGDIVVFSTVRCNREGDIGFLEDPRRLNVAWTRPKMGLIVVGDRTTLSSNALWSRALNACREVAVSPPEEVNPWVL